MFTKLKNAFILVTPCIVPVPVRNCRRAGFWAAGNRPDAIVILSELIVKMPKILKYRRLEQYCLSDLTWSDVEKSQNNMGDSQLVLI